MNFKINGKTNFIPETQVEKFLSVDKELRKKEKKEETDKNEEIPKNEIKEDKLLEQRKNNLQSIGINLKDITHELIDDISKTFQRYHEMKKINDDINTYKIMKNKVSEKLNYNYDFFNALKLYCYMIKKNIDFSNYIGIILEEKNKDKANELREYSMYKVTKMED